MAIISIALGLVGTCSTVALARHRRPVYNFRVCQDIPVKNWYMKAWWHKKGVTKDAWKWTYHAITFAHYPTQGCGQFHAVRPHSPVVIEIRKYSHHGAYWVKKTFRVNHPWTTFSNLQQGRTTFNHPRIRIDWSPSRKDGRSLGHNLINVAYKGTPGKVSMFAVCQKVDTNKWYGKIWWHKHGPLRRAWVWDSDGTADGKTAKTGCGKFHTVGHGALVTLELIGAKHKKWYHHTFRIEGRETIRMYGGTFAHPKVQVIHH